MFYEILYLFGDFGYHWAKTSERKVKELLTDKRPVSNKLVDFLLNFYQVAVYKKS